MRLGPILLKGPVPDRLGVFAVISSSCENARPQGEVAERLNAKCGSQRNASGMSSRSVLIGLARRIFVSGCGGIRGGLVDPNIF